MPDKGNKPPNKMVDEMVTKLTLEASERHEDEKILLIRYPKMLTYLTRKLAIAMVEIEQYKLIVDGKKQD